VAASLLITVICAAVGTETAGVGTLLVLGVPGALVALVLAIAAIAHGEQWKRLWAPLGLFPVSVVCLVLAALFLWE
jgi:hypothetical protein